MHSMKILSKTLAVISVGTSQTLVYYELKQIVMNELGDLWNCDLNHNMKDNC